MALRSIWKGRSGALKDKDVAYDLLKDSKFSLVGLTFALSECTDSQLRMILLDQFNRCVIDHHALIDLALKKDWYTAYAAPQIQMRIDTANSESTMN